MRLRRRPGLAALVPGLVVAAVLLTAGAAVFVALFFGRTLLLRQDVAELGRHAENYAAAVTFYLDGARSTIETMAALPAMSAALASPARAGRAGIEAAALRARLTLRHSRVFDDMALVALDGRVMILEPAALAAAQVRPDRGHARWFQEVVRGGQAVVSDLHLSMSTRQPTVVVASPVRAANGAMLGVLAGSLRLNELSRVASAADMTQGSYGFVTDRRGLVVAHQAAPRYVQHQTDFGAVPPVRAALAGQRGAGHFENPIERVEQLGAWLPLPGPGWAVVYEKPARAAMQPIRSLTLNLLTFSAGIAVLLGAVGVVLARRIVRPIEKLTEAAEAAGHVGPTPPSFPVENAGSAEAARLARALNRMVLAMADKDAALGQRTAELEQAVTDLEAAGHAKDQFLATISHELRTPLNAVYGWAQMLRRGGLDAATQRRAVEVIERNASAQAQLIDDLLDVSRIVTGKMRLDVRPVDLQAVVQAAVDTVRPAADAKGIRLQAVLDPRAAPLRGDPDRLQQVVWNLLVNAVKFTPRGGRVQVHLQRVRSHAEIAVSDTGRGIEPDDLPHLFERFRQVDSGPARAHGGLGIGLALVRHLVELHGGTITATSSGSGQGATFVVALPLLAAEPLETGEHPTARTRVDLAGPSLAGLRVLVVEDDPDSLDLVATILTAQGAAVRTSTGGADAVGALAAFRPHVLISDIEMPGEDGYSLIRRIRGLSPAQGSTVPAVALTAYGRTEDRVRALSAGFEIHLPKPVDPAELAAVVARLAHPAER